MSYDVDASKAPYYASGDLGEKQRKLLEKGNVDSGYMPIEEDQAPALNFVTKG